MTPLTSSAPSPVPPTSSPRPPATALKADLVDWLAAAGGDRADLEQLTKGELWELIEASP